MRDDFNPVVVVVAMECWSGPGVVVMVPGGGPLEDGENSGERLTTEQRDTQTRPSGSGREYQH